MISESLATTLNTAAVERATLLLNHVLAAEPLATRRLQRHAGRRVACTLVGWPGLLPALPALVFAITPAGLLEWCPQEPAEAADLHLRVDAANPAGLLARGLAGERPATEVSGDAALADDLNWLQANLRWDVEDDLARFVGPAAAHQMAAVARPLATPLRAALRGLASLADRAAGHGAQ